MIQMKLYTYDMAPNARRLQLFLNYKGIELETQQIDLGTLEQHGEEYAAINPLRTIPSLQLDDGTLLTEVIAQVAYLESQYPDKPLMGTTDLEKAQVLNWDHLIFLSGLAAIADMFRNRSKGFAGRAMTGALKLEQIPELAERGKLRLDAFWPMMEERLGKSSWVVNDNISYADIDLYCLVEFSGWVKEGIPQDCANLKDWHERATAELA
jgi:glutathione S-transferase